MKIYSSILILLFAALLMWQCTEDAPVGPQATPYDIPDISNFSAFPADPENPLTVEGVALGRQLFFDNILSSDFSMNCGTCHRPELSFSDGRVTSPGVDNVPGRRNAMTLVNLAWYEGFNWDGLETKVRDQNIHPVENDFEMNLAWPEAVQRIKGHSEYPALFEEAFPGEEIDRDLITKALEQFQLSLIAYNAPFDKYLREEATVDPAVLRGFEIFRTEKGDCFHCHSESNSPELFVTTRVIFTNNGLDTVETTDGFTDNGLGEVTGNPLDNGKFKIPTLRNLKYTAPYMHDGRFATLDEVIESYNRGPARSPSLDEVMLADAEKRLETFGHWGLNLSEQDKADLKAFLLSLTDDSFVTNPAYQAP